MAARAAWAIFPFLLLLAPGCAAPCQACHAAWQAQGVDPAVFAALDASPVAARAPPAGLPFDDATLAAAFGPRGFALAQADLAVGNVSVSASFRDGALRVRAPAGAPIRSAVEALAANLSLDPAPILDALGDNGTEARFSGGNATALWARLAPRLTGQEDHLFDRGEPVVAGPWTLRLAFALSVVRAQAGADALSVEANPRGAYSALLALGQPADAAHARARFDALLAQAGVKAQGWTLVPAG